MTRLDHTRTAEDLATPARRRWWGHRWVRVLAVVLLAAVLVAAGVVVFATPVLGVQRIVVRGGDARVQAEARRAAGIATGTPMIRVDVDAAARRVLADLPALHAVTVRRSWPRAVVVDVTPRVPIAAYLLDGGWQPVDGDGVVVGPPVRSPGTLVRLSRAASPATVAAATEVFDSLPAPLRGRVSTIEAASVDAITLHTNGRETIVWGGVDQADRKAAVLTALMKHRARVYNVSAPDQPTTRA